LPLYLYAALVFGQGEENGRKLGFYNTWQL
jgi:hypothetical protein